MTSSPSGATSTTATSTRSPGPPLHHHLQQLLHPRGPRAPSAGTGQSRGVRVRVLVPRDSDVKVRSSRAVTSTSGCCSRRGGLRVARRRTALQDRRDRRPLVHRGQLQLRRALHPQQPRAQRRHGKSGQWARLRKRIEMDMADSVKHRAGQVAQRSLVMRADRAFFYAFRWLL